MSENRLIATIIAVATIAGGGALADGPGFNSAGQHPDRGSVQQSSRRG